MTLTLLLDAPNATAQDDAPIRLRGGRFTVLAFPSEDALARSLLAAASRNDSFPGLPRPRQAVTIALAPDRRRFRDWIGPAAPEWGAAIAFPESHQIVMQGRSAGSKAGDPIEVLRHELAHLALYEALGDLPPRWFDEGFASYAAGELDREELLATNLALVLRGMPSLASLDSGFYAGEARAQASYALAYRAVAELASLDERRGLGLFFTYWKETRSFDIAIRRAYGMTAAAFEQRWRERTKRRYGVLAVFADLTLATLLMLAIITPLYVLRRRRDRARMAALVAADVAADRAARESAIAALLGEPGRPPEARDPDGGASSQ